jgi:hypothetical protein
MLRDSEGIASELLAKLGAHADDVRRLVDVEIAKHAESHRLGRLDLSRAMRPHACSRLALKEMSDLGDEFLSVEHLLLGHDQRR